MFSDCTNLTRVTIPDSITGIQADAFDECWNLTNCVIGTNVAYFGSGVFNYCSNLVNLQSPTVSPTSGMGFSINASG